MVNGPFILHSLLFIHKKIKESIMKFIHYLEKVTDVSIYPVISFCIFGVFFLAVATWVFKTDKKLMDKNSRIPLD